MKIKKLRKLMIATALTTLMLTACGKEKDITSTASEKQAEAAYEVQAETADAATSETDSEPAVSEVVEDEATTSKETTESVETITESETEDVSDLTPVEQFYKQLSDAFPQTKGREEEILSEAYSLYRNGVTLEDMIRDINFYADTDRTEFKLVSDSSFFDKTNIESYAEKFENTDNTDNIPYLKAATEENSRIFGGTVITVQDNIVFMWNSEGQTKIIEL